MKLHPVTKTHDGRNWCGIVALSAITGNPTEHSRQVLKQVMDELDLRNQYRGASRNVLKSVYTKELLASLRFMLVDTQQHTTKFKSGNNTIYFSVARYLHYKKPAKGNLFLITVPQHFIVTDGETILDSSFLNGIPAWQHPHIDSEVLECYECKQTEACEL